MDKTVGSADEAIRSIEDGMTVAVGGFGLCGNPENLIRALHKKKVRNLTIISNNCGIDDKGLGLLLAAGQVRKIVASYVGENKNFERQALAGSLEVELCPQGTFAERLRAAGAGIAGFYTPTAYGTELARGKEVREIDGRMVVLERPLSADVALVKAWRADPWGNLVYRKTARNFNPVIATCARFCVAEVEELVPLGGIDPDAVHTPGIYVQRVVRGQSYEKPIEQRTTRPRPVASRR
jgi:3-oxoacid CoA-transferase subunit A